jgi:hypothetical protein
MLARRGSLCDSKSLFIRRMGMAGLTVGVVGVLGEGVAEEQGLVESLGLGDIDGRSRGAEVLREGLSGLDGGESAGAAAVGVGLDVDGSAAAVDDNSLLSRGKAQEGGDGEDGDLHVERGEKSIMVR